MSASAHDSDPAKPYMHVLRDGDDEISPEPQAHGLELVCRAPDKAGELAVFARYRENKTIADLTAYRDGKPH